MRKQRAEEQLALREKKEAMKWEGSIKPITTDEIAPIFNDDQKIDIYRSIIEAETFEEFLQSKFLGQKRFSLEGGETLMAILNSILNRSEKNNVNESYKYIW